MVFGDTHGHLDWMFALTTLWELENQKEIDVIFQVGDFGIWPSADRVDSATRKHAGDNDPAGDFPKYLSGEEAPFKPTYFCRGNHEDQEFLIERTKADRYQGNRPVQICENLSYIPDGCCFDLNGIKVAALGGNFSGKTWEMNESWDKRQGKRQNHIVRDAFETLMWYPDSIDILLTHDAPSGIGLGELALRKEGDRVLDGCRYIRELIERKVSQYSFNGHWHHYIECTIGRSSHYSLGRTERGAPIEGCFKVIEI